MMKAWLRQWVILLGLNDPPRDPWPSHWPKQFTYPSWMTPDDWP